MSFTRNLSVGGSGAADQTRRLTVVHEERRRTLQTRQVATGTLACARCDAPVAIGPGTHSPAHSLICPFCAHRAPLREFLTLAALPRPARVTIKLRERSSR